jgi:hypothetical protein
LTKLLVACCSDAATGAAKTVVLITGASVAAPNVIAHRVLRSIFISSPFYLLYRNFFNVPILNQFLLLIIEKIRSFVLLLMLNVDFSTS